MTAQFLRAAAVTVGKVGENGTRFFGLRVSFDIEKNTSGDPNDAKIHIYNLSSKSRAAVEESDLIVRLDVGYWGLENRDPAKLVLSQLFTGNLRYSASRRQGPDYVTTLEVGDDEKAITEAVLDRSFPAGTSYDVVIKALAGQLKVAVGTIAPAVGKFFENGVSITGNVSKSLDDLVKSAGLEWHVTDNELNILPKDAPITEPALLVTPATGLIGTPSKRRDSKTKSFTPGYEFKMLINPGVKPGRIIALAGQTVNANVRVDTVRFNGDTHFGDWVANVEAS